MGRVAVGNEMRGIAGLLPADARAMVTPSSELPELHSVSPCDLRILASTSVHKSLHTSDKGAFTPSAPTH